MFRAQRQREEDASVSAAANVAAAPVGSVAQIQAVVGNERPLGTLAPEIPSASVKSPFARGSSSGTLGCMSPPGGPSPSARRLLTNRWSGRVMNKVPSSYNGGRAAQLKR
jgi:hypothetical protein